MQQYQLFIHCFLQPVKGNIYKNIFLLATFLLGHDVSGERAGLTYNGRYFRKEFFMNKRMNENE